MKENEAVERVVGRVYKDHLVNTGRLPNGKETRGMEKRVREAVESFGNKSERKGSGLHRTNG